MNKTWTDDVKLFLAYFRISTYFFLNRSIITHYYTLMNMFQLVIAE